MPSASNELVPRRGWLPVLGALLLALAAYLVADVRARPPEPAPGSSSGLGASNAAPEEAFSARRALTVLRRLVGDVGPRPAGTEAHELVRERLVAELRDLGLRPTVEVGFGLGPYGYSAVTRNVVARVPAADGRTDEAVLLVAHYDSEGQALGAGDDGSGVAILLETARALLAGPPPRRPVVLLFTDAEEAGLVGAVTFCAREGALDDVAVVVNAEARGTEGPSRMFQTYGDNAWLIEALAQASPRPRASSVSDLAYKSMPNDTDLTVFGEHGVPGLNFAFIRGLARYHTPRDDLDHLSAASVQEQGENVLGLARALGDALADGEARRPGSVVYADVLSYGVLAWPIAWGPWLAAAALVVALASAVRARATGAAGAGGLLLAVVGCALAPAACVVATWIWLKTATETSGVPNPATATAWPWVLGLLALCAAISLGVHGVLARIAGFASAWIAGWLVAAGGALALALKLPEASYLLTVPALAAALVVWPSGVLRGRGGARSRSRLGPTVACLVPFAAAALFWMPLQIGLQHGFGFRSGAGTRQDLVNAACLAAPLAVVWVTLAPLLAFGMWRALATAVGLSFAVWLGATGLGLALPAHDVDAPAWINVRYVLDADRGVARWDVSTFGLELPAELAAAGGLERATTPPFPWLSLDRSLYAGPAPVWDVPPPTFEVLESSPVEGGRVVRGRVRSPRGTTRLHVHLPAHVDLVAARWREHEIRGFAKLPGHIFCAIPAEDGLVVELLAEGTEPFDVWLLDEDWTLPPEARALLAARPAWAVPRGDGDVSIVGRSVRVE